MSIDFTPSSPRPVPPTPTDFPQRDVDIRSRSNTILLNRDSRQLLIGMGFPSSRAEKALAATGDQNVQVAADWLLSHVFDPELDLTAPREYIVYACPLGVLGTQVEEFTEKTLLTCGRNAAHKSFAHLTLCQFFQCPDAMLPQLLHTLKRCIEASMLIAPKEIKLKRYSTHSYIGLFIDEESASWFRNMMDAFAAEAKTSGVVVKPHRKQLHVTLAHQYPIEQQAQLEQLALTTVDPAAPVKWELSLYSRDRRLAVSEVYKVLYPYQPQKEDELELAEGDYVYVSTADEGRTESEGWYHGTSHSTGISGLYPGNFVEKAKDSDCWVLHRSCPLMGSAGKPSNTTAADKQGASVAMTEGKSDPPPTDKDHSLYVGAAGLLPDMKTNVERLYARVDKKRRDESSLSSDVNEEGEDLPVPSTASRRLFICRHAERVDVTFGKQWISLSFDSNGLYTRRNLNMPRDIPKRRGGPGDFAKDSPITEMGVYQAKLTGEGMREQGIRLSHVFCSPALRCVQTADAILKGLQETNVKIKIENGMFEWLAWFQGAFPPPFITPAELAKFGMQVDASYKSQVSLQDLKPNETHLEFYKRMVNLTKLLLKIVGPGAGNVMFVGHAATLETCTRQLIGAHPCSLQDLTKLVQKVPYCGMCVCQESDSGGKSSTWDFIDPPVPPLTHAPNVRFDWRCMQ